MVEMNFAPTETLEAHLASTALPLELNNARELGGIVLKDGRKVRRGVLLRTSRLFDASERDLEKLRTQIPDFRKYIDRLSVYMQSRKKTYPDHAATILRWAQQDNAVQPVRTYTYEEGESL